jgi:hypothetical protein
LTPEARVVAAIADSVTKSFFDFVIELPFMYLSINNGDPLTSLATVYVEGPVPSEMSFML